MDNGTYKVNVYCTNCDFRGDIDIPKGQIIEHTKCNNCGNPKLTKNMNVNLDSDNDSFV